MYHNLKAIKCCVAKLIRQNESYDLFCKKDCGICKEIRMELYKDMDFFQMDYDALRKRLNLLKKKNLMIMYEPIIQCSPNTDAVYYHMKVNLRKNISRLFSTR